MSLEEALKENTEALNRLSDLLSHTIQLPAQGSGIMGTANTVAPALTYEADVRKPFLKLLNSKREAAMKLLADLGVQNLKGFESRPELFTELSQKIQAAQNE